MISSRQVRSKPFITESTVMMSHTPAAMPDDADPGDDRDEGLAALGQQVADRDEPLGGQPRVEEPGGRHGNAARAATTSADATPSSAPDHRDRASVGAVGRRAANRATATPNAPVQPSRQSKLLDLADDRTAAADATRSHRAPAINATAVQGALAYTTRPVPAE